MALFNSLDKKRIAFVGNSFTFYGGCVRGSKFDELDDGCFYKLAHSFGDDVTVTNFTWGGASFWHKGNAFSERALYTKMKELHPAFYNNPQGLPLDDFYRQDIVIFQQSGDRIAETYEDAMLIARLFRRRLLSSSAAWLACYPKALRKPWRICLPPLTPKRKRSLAAKPANSLWKPSLRLCRKCWAAAPI